MKRFTKIVTVVLTLALCLVIVPSKPTAAKSKNIYFAGEYQKKLKYGDRYKIILNQFSSPEGKVLGSFEVQYYSSVSKAWHSWGTKNIKRIGTNSYKAGKYRFKVYKKKLILKKAGDLNGTYKLKKRFIS